MNRVTIEDAAFHDYPVQYFSNSSVEIEETDVIGLWESSSSQWLPEDFGKIFRRNSTSVHDLFEVDFSSIQPHLEARTETALIDGSSAITEEDIVSEMVDHDFVVKMLPKKRRRIRVNVRKIRKGQPKLSDPKDFLVAE